MATLITLRGYLAFVLFFVLLCVQNSLQATVVVTITGTSASPSPVTVAIGDTITIKDGNNGGDNYVTIGTPNDVFYSSFWLLSHGQRNVYMGPDTYPAGISFQILARWTLDVTISGSAGLTSAPAKGYSSVCQEIDLNGLESTSNIEFSTGQCTVYTDSLCTTAAVSGAPSSGIARPFYFICADGGGSIYSQLLKFWQPLPSLKGLFFATMAVYPPISYATIGSMKAGSCTSTTVIDPINSQSVTFSVNNCKTYPDGLCMTPVSTPLAISTGSLEVWVKCDAALTTQTIQVTSEYFASANSNQFVVYNPIAITSVTPQRATGCAGSATGQLSVAYSGGNPSVATTVEWRVSGGTTVGSTATITGVSPGSYDVYLTNGPDTANQLNIIVQDVANPLTVTNPQSTPPKCFGSQDGTATADGTGGTIPYTFNWVDNLNQPISTFTTTPSSTAATALYGKNYRVIVTDGNNCQTDHTFSLTDPAKVVVTPLPQTDANCFGDTGSATVSVAGGTNLYSYSWSPNPTVASTSKTATGLVVGIKYTVTVTDTNNCQDSADFTINGPAAPLTATPSFTIPDCFGNPTGTASVAAAGGTGPYHYDWKGAGPDQATIGTLSAGSYPVTVTDSKGCTKDTTVTFADPPKLVISSQDQSNLKCNGDSSGEASVVVSGGTGAYTYTWPSGVSSTSKSASGLAATTYVLNVKDAKNCPLPVTFVLTQPDPITATYTQKDVLCKGDSTGEIAVTAQGGNSGYQYTWTPTSASTTSKATGLKAGSYTFSVTDSKNCAPFTSAAITILEPTSALSVAPSHVDLTCRGVSTGEVSVSASGGTGSYTYAWSNSLAPVAKPAATLAAGTYTSTVTDANGCKVVQDIVVAQPNLFAIQPAFTPVQCYGGSATLRANASGGTVPYTYNWYPAGGADDSTTLVPSGIYQVTATDSCSVARVQSVIVGQPTQLVIVPSQTNVACNGDASGTAYAYASGGTPPYTYSWSPSGGELATATGLVAGTYTVTVTDANGCQATQRFIITQFDAISINYTPFNATCHGKSNGNVSLAVSGGSRRYMYSWFPQVSNRASASALAAGTYRVTVSDSSFCSASQDIEIAEPDAPLTITGTTNSPPAIGGFGNVSATVTGGTPPYTYLWTNGGGSNATTVGVVAGQYELTVTDANGCIATESFTITDPQPAKSKDTFPLKVGLGLGLGVGLTTVGAAGAFAIFKMRAHKVDMNRYLL